MTPTAAAAACCAVLAGTAAALLLPGRARVAVPGARRRPASGRTGSLLAAAAATTAAVVVHGRMLVLVLVAAGAMAGAARLLARGHAAKAAAAQEARVVELCEALAGELRAGQPPQRALDHCAVTWPELQPVAGAARLDADVAVALRRLASARGAHALADLAAAWQVSAASGAGLAVAVSRIADSARHEHATRALVSAELASARATAWLVALLPLVSLTLGAGIGGRPWHFLLATLPGLGCLALGIALVLAGVSWTDRIAARAQAP